VFAVGHLVDEVAIVPADSEGRVHDDWAAHQLKTTANFSTDSAFFFWTVGGLNFQIEHHLFPTVCHVHYPAIAPIVQRTAAEFGLAYVSYPSFVHAMAAHVRFLRRYGQAPAESVGGIAEPDQIGRSVALNSRVRCNRTVVNTRLVRRRCHAALMGTVACDPSEGWSKRA
jgi:linoleoyl-CoA desaturase